GERGEHRGGVLRPGAVVEGEHHLALAQEIMALEVLEAEAGASRGVDLDHPRDPQGIGIAARGRHGGGHRRGLSGGRGGRRWAPQLAQRSRPHYPQPSQLSREPGPRWGLPGPLARARPPAPEWRLFVRKWRQTPPHTAQSPAWTLSLPDACPTSNPFRSVPLIRHRPNFGPYPLIQP